MVRFIEACKFAYAKRTLLGDWNVGDISKSVRDTVANLTSEQWWDQVRDIIDDNGTSQDPKFYGAQYSDIEDHGTAHMSILAPNGEKRIFKGVSENICASQVMQYL